MAAKVASRYTSLKSQSSPSSSTDFSSPSINKPTLDRSSSTRTHSNSSSSSILAKANNPKRPEQNFAAMVRKFMEKKNSTPKILTAGAGSRAPIIVPADFISEELKTTTKTTKGSNLTALPRKLFRKGLGNTGGTGSSSTEGKKKCGGGVKALTDVNPNTRTLAMVLRSERELLSLNKDQQAQILDLQSSLDERNREVDKLKDLCLKQREEIKALKSAILFPEEMNSQLQELLEKQGSELKQARKVIPTLQRQITSLTGQLQFLSEDLAEVKADKYSSASRSGLKGGLSPPRTPIYDYEDDLNSLDFSSGDTATPDSPDDMFLKDMNPCTTPLSAKEKSKVFEALAYDSEEDNTFMQMDTKMHHDMGINFRSRKLSRSSDYCQNPKPGSSKAGRTARKSDESKYMSWK